MKNPLEIIAQKPWLLVIAGFVVLISVWVVFFTLAARNQPVILPH
jgi:hypothetical protein